jgi:uncharacterized HAD superfamily protein
MRILSDLDGVIVDFFGQMTQFWNKVTGSNVSYKELTDYDLAACYGVTREAFEAVKDLYEERFDQALLPFVGEAFESLSELSAEGHQIIIGTGRKPSLQEMTRRCVLSRLPFIDQVHFSKAACIYSNHEGLTKQEICEMLGIDLMIDDFPSEFRDWKIKTVPWMFTQPWNERVPHEPRGQWPEIVKYVRSHA